MIKLLDTDTINKIAAGEVIERPASVVKELVENAVDAGADRISVELENGGLSLIRVSDNGSGIEKGDIRNAFVKHATSKISSIDDLNEVGTLGFRGEALSSIAAVSEVQLLTKTGEGLTGYSYSITGGSEESFEETGVPEGTTVVVRELFFNTPVRKKFLRSEAAEGAAVLSLMEKLALSRPDISFKLTAGGKEKLYTTGNGKLKDVIYAIYGRDIVKNLIEINAENEEVKIGGFIGKPAISRGNRSFENYAVNGRFISNDSLSMAIEDAYKGYIMLHNFPFTALLFEIDPALLDVNVHPAKRELRLTASDSVCTFVRETLRSAIEGADIVPDVVPGKETEKRGPRDKYDMDEPEKTQLFVKDESVAPFTTFAEPGTPTAEQTTFFAEPTASSAEPVEADKTGSAVSVEAREPEATVISEPAACEQQEFQGVRKTNKFRLIGQLFATYWLIEAGDTFYMMDQHAAHEKILYERLLKTVGEKKSQTQYLTVPVVINVSPETGAYLEGATEVFECFNSLGYELEDFGDNTVKITGIPAGLPVMDYKQMVTDVLDSLCEKTDIGISPGDTPQIMIEKIASMSCKAAIKGNDRISETEALSLLEEMMEAENPYNCPHGRPTLVAMSKYEIEKKFKRIV